MRFVLRVSAGCAVVLLSALHAPGAALMTLHRAVWQTFMMTVGLDQSGMQVLIPGKSMARR